MAAVDQPGTVFLNGAGGSCHAAFVFAPDHPATPSTLRDLGLLALFEAVAALAPPQSPMSIAPPDRLLLDGGLVATVRAEVGPGDPPEWAVLGLEIAVDLQEATTPADLLERICRQMLGWIDRWHEDGAATLAATVRQRSNSVALAV